ncbi:hypothetical protein BDM02DRAFT_3113414 [Thelephora ganbajun]|uniref:Uncharacterized protein n=1 Tax=Thelephora ganbajun TaxID=370292 RepID=A0ACB6ZJH5_THEGA|nr:hypothetical protein BDM02DRAFT_3113414 [Thelephora ganbajun]
MAGYSSREPKLCWLGRAAQKLGCLPDRSPTSTPLYYYPIDSGRGYSDDIKYKPGPRLPPPQPDKPELQMTPYVTTYRQQPSRVPKSPKKTPVAQTVPLSTLPLPVNALPTYIPTPTCVTLNADLPPVNPTVQINHSPYLAPLSAVSRTPHQNTVPDSVLQDLRTISPSQYTWNTPHGVLTYTPAPASQLPLPNPLADFGPCSPRIVDVGDGNDGTVGLGLIPSPTSSNSSDSSSDCSDSDYQSGFTLNFLLISNRLLSKETPIEWDVSEPVETVRHILDDERFLANAREPVTNPPTNTIRIEFCFIDQPGVRWNWESITIRKPRPIRIADVFHAIYRYFQLQLTVAEWDIVKSHGKDNARIVANSWRERVASHLEEGARSVVYQGGLRRVDCLGSSKIFAGLWVEGSQLKLGLRA